MRNARLPEHPRSLRPSRQLDRPHLLRTLPALHRAKPDEAVDSGQLTVKYRLSQLSTVNCQLSTKKVGVFVNATIESMMEKASTYKLDYLQLHGNESPEDCHTLQKRGYSLIKAFPIATKEDFEKTREYEGRVDYFLFDTRCEGYGGSGKRFDWSILTEYKGETPFLLSGGIRPENAEAIRNFRHPRFAGIDLNSGFEIEPGLKDVDKLKNFIQQILHPAVETGRAPSPTV